MYSVSAVRPTCTFIHQTRAWWDSGCTFHSISYTLLTHRDNVDFPLCRVLGIGFLFPNIIPRNNPEYGRERKNSAKGSDTMRSTCGDVLNWKHVK